MRKLAIALAATAMLAACGDTSDADGTADGDAPSLALEAITYPVIEANDIYGAGCTYVDTGSIAPLLIAMDDSAWFKLAGNVVKLEPTPDSEELPYLARSAYSAEGYQATVAIESEGTGAGYETMNYNGTITISDAAGTVLDQRSGTIQCGA
jgi:hypothetical protein